MLLTIWLWCRACWIIQNAFLNDPKCQKQGFMDLQLVDWLDIAYYAKTNCFLTFGNTSRSQRIIQKYKKGIFEWSKVPKRRILANICSLVSWIDLILHIAIKINVTSHEGFFRVHTNSFLNDPNSLKRVFWPLVQRCVKNEVVGTLFKNQRRKYAAYGTLWATGYNFSTYLKNILLLRTSSQYSIICWIKCSFGFLFTICMVSLAYFSQFPGFAACSA